MMITLIITVIKAIIIIPAKTLQKNTLKIESIRTINLEKKYTGFDLEWILLTSTVSWCLVNYLTRIPFNYLF